MHQRFWVGLLVASAMIASVPAANAAESTDSECAAPPCGWIAPLLDLIIDDKPACGGGYILGGELNPADCLAPPQDGEPLVLEGTFRLYWELCEEATYLNDAQDPIEVRFSSTNRNPTFIDYSIEPSTFTLDTVTLFSPDYIVPGEKHDGSPTCWYDYQQPITITFTRNGDPGEADIESILNQNCVAQYYVKIQSDESGERFKAGWGIEPFRFHMLNDPLGTEICEGKTTPALGAAPLVAGLGAVALARRR